MFSSFPRECFYIMKKFYLSHSLDIPLYTIFGLHLYIQYINHVISIYLIIKYTYTVCDLKEYVYLTCSNVVCGDTSVITRCCICHIMHSYGISVRRHRVLKHVIDLNMSYTFDDDFKLFCLFSLLRKGRKPCSKYDSI